MSDQHPVYSPPPDYTPEPPPGAYGTDVYGAPAQSAPPLAGPPKKKPKALIIALVVGCLLVCCCVTGGGAAFLLFSPSNSVTTTGDVSGEDVFGDLPEGEADARLDEWLDWSPDVQPMMSSAPAEKDSLILEGLGIVAPEFSMEEAVWYAGEYDVAEDWYYADGFYVRASHPSSADISAAVEMWVQSDQMVAEQVDFETQEGDLLSSVAGRQLVYRAQWGADGFRFAGEEDLALWEQLGQDWPDGVVVDASGDCTSGFVVSVTKWPAYAVDADYPTVSVRYRYEGDEWMIEDWEYVYPDGSTT